MTAPSVSHSAVGRRSLACLALALAVTSAPLDPGAAAAETVPRPPSGQLTLTGHGYGHGRGMSQWGAYGAAQVAGLSHQQILDFYYPGTTRNVLGNDIIRVALSDNDGDTVVAPAAGLSVVSSGGRAALPTGAAYVRWRVTGTAALRLEFQDAAGTWRAYTPSGVALGSDVAFAGPATVQVLLPDGSGQEVRGEVHSTLVANQARTVLYTPLETYLRGVVPNEMPASWHRQALAAQSVAARTYAAAYRQRQRAAGSWYDICDTTACQVFSGVARYSGGVRTPKEDPRTDAAIAETAGVVLRAGSSGALINAEFSSANGGWTVDGGVSYQVAKPDPYDGMVKNASNTWTTNVAVSRLDGVRGIGRFRSLVVTARDGHGAFGGRILKARLEGEAGSAEVTGEQLRFLLGVKSAWFATGASSRALTRDWTGDGVPDVLARDASGDLQLYAGAGGRFGDGRRVGVGWGDMADLIAAGDFDGRGGQDVIARHRDGRLYFYGGDGAGGWISQTQIGHGWGGFRTFASPGDWNGDGRPDVVAIHTAGHQLVMSAGGGTYLHDPVVIGVGWGDMVRLITPGDFDGDGAVDLLAQTTGGDLWCYSSDGRGNIIRARKIGNGWGGMSAVWSVGDVDGDGAADLLAVDGAGSLWLYRGTGSGGFGAVTKLGDGWSGRTPVS